MGSRSVYAGSRTFVCLMLACAAACEAPVASAEDADATGTSNADTGSDSESGHSGEAASCVPELVDDCMDPNLKCMPWAESMGPPTDHQCCPLNPAPVSLGERCEVQDYVHSCIDDCPAGSMCLIDDADTLGGYCHEFCDITEPDACGAEGMCRPLFTNNQEATTPLCLLRCDPLLQDCGDRNRASWNCVPTSPVAAEFTCLPPTLPTAKLEFEDCKIPSDCAPGLICVSASEMFGCSAERCCTPLCDLNQDPSVCTMGNACVSLESDIPGLEAVGVCIDPSS